MRKHSIEIRTIFGRIRYLLVGFLLLICTIEPAVPVQAATRLETGMATSATLLRMSDRSLDARLSDMQNMGIRWIRIDFSWPVIQPFNDNVFHWSMFDRIIRVAGVHGLKVLAVLDYTPNWAAEPVCKQLVITKAAATKCQPSRLDLFGRFARAAAIHFAHTSVRAWEIWNEPNLSAYWKVAQDNNSVLSSPLSYARLANVAAAQIRQNDPDSLIITGGLAPLFEAVYPKGYRQSDFLMRVLPHLNRNLFDGIGIHPYSWPVMPATQAVYNAFYTVGHGSPQYNLQTILHVNGWADKQVWATEFGAPTIGESTVLAPTATSRPDHVSESAQATIISQGIVKWYSQPNVGPLFVEADSDQWLPKVPGVSGFGLRRADGSAKPAYSALIQAEKELYPQIRW